MTQVVFADIFLSSLNLTGEAAGAESGGGGGGGGDSHLEALMNVGLLTHLKANNASRSPQTLKNLGHSAN